MFGNRYFAPRYFGDRYFAPGGDQVVPVVDTMDMHDGYRSRPRSHDWLDRERRNREDRRDRLQRASDDVNGIRRPEVEAPTRPLVTVNSAELAALLARRAEAIQAGLQQELAAAQAELLAFRQHQAAQRRTAINRQTIELLLLAA